MFSFLLFILCLVCVFGLLASALELLAGQGGAVSLMHGAWFGVGAYTYALVVNSPPLGFISASVISGVVGSTAAILCFALCGRLHGSEFVLSTLALGVVFFSLFNNLDSVTGGTVGLSGIPRPEILSWRVDRSEEYLIVLAGLWAAALYCLHRLGRRGFGRALRLVREDERLASMLRVSAVRVKLRAFVLSGFLAGVAGGLYAAFFTFIDPSSFAVAVSIYALTLVLVGGLGSVFGPLIGALAIGVLGEAVRFLGGSSSHLANLQQILFGTALMLVVLWRPRGLIGRIDLGSSEG